MDAAAAEIGRNPVSKHQISLSMEMSRLTRDGTAEPVSRIQIFRRERGQGNINFLCSADHEQDWQPYPVDISLATVYVMIIHTYITKTDQVCVCVCVCVFPHLYADGANQ